MDHHLHGINLGMSEKGIERRADDRFSRDLPILLWHLAAGAITPTGCDNDSRNAARHELGSVCDSGMALAHVGA
jgi:hypothetical protein